MNQGAKTMHRRDFLKAAPAAALMVAHATKAGTFSLKADDSAATIKLQPFDYRGVRLLGSRFLQQYQHAREYYYSVPDDDILKGFRAAAGLPAPGTTLGGWCERDSSTVFGQWLSGMSRMYRATGDTAMRDKALRLFTEWAKTVKPDGDCRMRHYTYDKMVCGLVDMKLYADCDEAIPMLERITDWASRTLSRENIPARARPDGVYQGRPSEWYTLSENLFRAYQLTGNPKFRTFAEVWLYHPYWNKFAQTAAPSDAHGVHAYSHVNSLSSAAMAYAVTGDPVYLQIIKNAYDYLQNFQCYAPGGFGPAETLMAPNGSLGRALESRYNTFETGCGSWAGFKLSRYLMGFTGESRYGDWMERLFYNGIGAALPITTGGKNFYYSDYRVAGGMKVYLWEFYTCCSGTYIQDVSDYHNNIYFKDGGGLYVNLYVPSEVVWQGPDGEVKLIQETQYPEEETSFLRLEMKESVKFALRFRVPGWSRDVAAKVNGAAVDVKCVPGSWATIERTWSSGDSVEIRIPLRMRMEAVDRQHPDRVAIVRGPAVLVLDSDHHESELRLPKEDEELAKWLVPDNPPSVFRIQPPGAGRIGSKFRPFYAAGENYPYQMYFDRDALPYSLW
jgi:hypothetical protein